MLVVRTPIPPRIFRNPPEPTPEDPRTTETFLMSPKSTTLNISFANFATEQAIRLSPVVAGNLNVLNVIKRVTLPEHVPNRERGQAV